MSREIAFSNTKLGNLERQGFLVPTKEIRRKETFLLVYSNLTALPPV